MKVKKRLKINHNIIMIKCRMFINDIKIMKSTINRFIYYLSKVGKIEIGKYKLFDYNIIMRLKA